MPLIPAGAAHVRVLRGSKTPGGHQPSPKTVPQELALAENKPGGADGTHLGCADLRAQAGAAPVLLPQDASRSCVICPP